VDITLEAAVVEVVKTLAHKLVVPEEVVPAHHKLLMVVELQLLEL
jgi:hypothetical protein